MWRQGVHTGREAMPRPTKSQRCAPSRGPGLGSRIRTAGVGTGCTIPDDNPKSASQHGVTERARGRDSGAARSKGVRGPQGDLGFLCIYPRKGFFFAILPTG